VVSENKIQEFYIFQQIMSASFYFVMPPSVCPIVFVIMYHLETHIFIAKIKGQHFFSLILVYLVLLFTKLNKPLPKVENFFLKPKENFVRYFQGNGSGG
jgi:hypothetical protein